MRNCKVHLEDNCLAACTLPDELRKEVKEIFMEGQLIVYPTETLYGLGTNPFDEDCVEKIFSVKNRPKSMAISIAVPDIETLRGIAVLNLTAERICKTLLPGPLTLLLNKRSKVPDVLTAGSEKVGIRMPDHPLASNLLEFLGPMTCTSANLHGKAEPKRADIALEQLGESVSFYFDCGPCTYQRPSTIIDASEDSIKIIRKGVVPEAEIRGKIAKQS